MEKEQIDNMLSSMLVGVISLGCDKNRVDLEKIIYNIKKSGFRIVNDPSKANIIIVNTCAFLESARLEAIQNILEMSDYKNKHLEKLIFLNIFYWTSVKNSDFDSERIFLKR